MAKSKLPVQRDQWLWVLTKTTRVSEEPNALGVLDVTVQLPNGNLETMPYNPDKMRPDDDLDNRRHP
jgi:hypothetical protein